MKKLIITIFVVSSIQIWSQSKIGIGLVSIDFDDNTVLEFFSDTLKTKPTKIIEFFNDKSIDSWNIKDIDKQIKWLKPEVLWLDYHALNFRCLKKTKNWYQVIVNNKNGKTYWLKKNNLTKYSSWETYLKNMLGVARLSNFPQKIRTKPNANAKEIEYKGNDCFVVKSMKGEWIEISTPDYCNELNSNENVSIKSGWIKWRKENKLLIEFFITN